MLLASLARSCTSSTSSSLIALSRNRFATLAAVSAIAPQNATSRLHRRSNLRHVSSASTLPLSHRHSSPFNVSFRCLSHATLNTIRLHAFISSNPFSLHRQRPSSPFESSCPALSLLSALSCSTMSARSTYSASTLCRMSFSVPPSCRALSTAPEASAANLSLSQTFHPFTGALHLSSPTDVNGSPTPVNTTAPWSDSIFSDCCAICIQ